VSKDISGRIAGLSPDEKRALLARLLSEDGGRHADKVSVAQRRFWVLRQMEATVPTHVTAVYEVHGGLDLDRLQECLAAVVGRHALLRVAFVEVEGRPLRVALPQSWTGASLVDVSTRSLEEQDAAVADVVAGDARQPFALESGPLARLTVVRRGALHHVLVVTAHQLVADRASLAVITTELAELYAAGTEGREARLDPAAASFDEFAAWQREWLASAEGEADLDWWRGRLAGVVPGGVPTERPGVRVQAFEGARRSWRVPDELRVGIDRLAAGAGVDTRMVVVAALEVVLARWSGSTDLPVGVPVAGRWRARWGQVVGPCENTLVWRTDLTGNPSFHEILARLRQVAAEAWTHRLVPFERLVEELAPHSDVGVAPLFQVRVLLDDAPPQRWRAGALRWEEVDAATGLAPFEVTVRVAPSADGAMAVLVEFAVGAVAPDTAERLLAHLEVVLEAAVADPGRRLAEIPLLPEAERAALASWNATGRPFPADCCVHELIEQQADRSPTAVALIAGGARLSYRELDERANRLAHCLRAGGVGPETRVGLVAERHAAVVVGLLGVLKSGGAFVPLDPEWPAARVAFVCQDAGVEMVVCPRRLWDRFGGSWRLVCPEEQGSPAMGWPAERPALLAGPDNLADVMYTSGSTGQPKGVLVAHRQLVNSTMARYDFFPGKVGAYLMLAPISFDASAAGLYWPLSTGGTLIYPTDHQLRDPRLLARLVTEYQASHLDGAPSQYEVLVEAVPQALQGLRCCILAGEPLPPYLVERHYHAVPGTPLFNEYGPTEATVWSTAYLCRPTGGDGTGTVPIGRPVANVRVHVLDRDLNLAPVGVPGELCIAGANLARGYLNQPGFTAERFVPNPHGLAPGERLYRTGDLARWRADGSLEFLGRADTQVKIRGFRVELEEIEAQLGAHHGVVQAAVAASQGGPGDTRLIGYVVPRAGQAAPSNQELMAFLAERLPGYMVPSLFVTLDAMPQNPQGKVDRQRLPTPAQAAGAASQALEEPRTKLERETAQTFAEALGVERVSLHDDFFTLGGNSLQMARIGARLSAAFGLELPLHALFTVPTVAGVASRIELLQREGFKGLLATRDPVAMLDAEAVLDPSINVEGLPLADISSPGGIFLTGATGYVGIFLVEQLLEQTGADVHCLVRAKDPEEALERLRRTAAHFKVDWDERWDARVRAVVGDLAKPLFGLERSAFEALARTVDVIYHNGALVNFALPYSVLKGPNVVGTVEVLRLASTTTAKLVNYVSTIDVFIGSHMPRPFLERDLPERPPRVPFSYPQSKWVSEKLLVASRARGLPVTIFRPSIMMGHTRTGACHEMNYVLVGLRGFLDLGVLPRYDEILNAVTIDYATRVLVHVSRQESSIGGIFHIWNVDALPTTATYEWVRSYGYDFEVVPFDEALEKAIRAGPEHPIFPLVPVMLLYSSGDAGLPMDWDTERAIDNRIECASTLAAIEDYPIECPPIDEPYLHACLSFLIERGVLKPPRRRVAVSPP
jgi:myxalamid-type nonribosomal peptide synthetase MxaA